MITATQQLENYLESFSEFEKLAAGHDLPWLRKLRRDAFARFCEVGFPTTRDEDWRFTNVSADRADALPACAERPRRLSQENWSPTGLPGAACQLVFVDGRFAPRAVVAGRAARWREGRAVLPRRFRAIPERSNRTSAATPISSAMPSAR